jgi:2-haloacid dehalogenase
MGGTAEVIVFDVNETLSDMSGLADRFAGVGAPPQLAQLWFAGLLRDGFALAASGDNAGFAEVAAGLLHELLRPLPLNRAPAQAVDDIMAAFAGLGVHPDVVPGIRRLRSAGFRLVTLSNGAPEVADNLLRKAGIREEFEALLSVQEAAAWKPAKAAYDYAARACRTRPASMLLVAVHPWDIHGAARAGLRTAWLNRAQAGYPSYFAAPDYAVGTLVELASAVHAPA